MEKESVGQQASDEGLDYSPRLGRLVVRQYQRLGEHSQHLHTSLQRDRRADYHRLTNSTVNEHGVRLSQPGSWFRFGLHPPLVMKAGP